MTNSLGIRFLQQCTPEFSGIARMSKVQPAVVGWEVIVYDHFHPFSIAPEVKPEHAAVDAFVETLVGWDDVVKQVFGVCEGGYGSDEPTVAYPSLGDV